MGVTPSTIMDVSTGPITQDTSLQQEIWFKGAFMYFANHSDTVSGKFEEFGRKANLVLGQNLTPETLWELAPWSWLVDWVLNVGDAMSNYTRFQNNNLVLRYGYLMRKTTAINTFTVSGLRFKAGNKDPGPVSRSFVEVTKERYKATPFGFGLDPGTFSSEQWAILAALGLSKGGKALW
jgi:hypothetical protein